MGDMKEAARTAMAANLLSSVVTAEHKPAKESLLADMVDAGVERVRVVNDEGLNFGAVSLVGGTAKAKVTDDRAFVAWVAERYPDELVKAVRESFTKKVLAAATEVGEAVDVETGEVVPGVEIVAGEPYLTVRPTADAKVRMRDTLLASGLLQLPSGSAA